MTTEQKTEQLRLRRINLEIWAAIIILGLAALVSYFLLDEQAFSWLRRHRSNWYKNDWLQAFTLLGKAWVLIWLLLSWVLATGRHRPALVAILVLLLISPAVISLKAIVQRPRPADIAKVHSRAEDRNYVVRSWSFPSGDTAAVFAVATALAPFVRWPWGLTFFTVASSIGILRLAMLAHYPSDVCAGAAIGMLISWLASQITSKCRLPELSGFNWYRAIAAVGMIVISLSLGLFEGINQLLTFLKTYGVLVLLIYIAVKGSACSKRLRKYSPYSD